MDDPITERKIKKLDSSSKLQTKRGNVKNRVVVDDTDARLEIQGKQKRDQRLSAAWQKRAESKEPSKTKRTRALIQSQGGKVNATVDTPPKSKLKKPKPRKTELQALEEGQLGESKVNVAFERRLMEARMTKPKRKQTKSPETETKTQAIQRNKRANTRTHVRDMSETKPRTSRNSNKK